MLPPLCNMVQQKSLFVTYVLWLFFGWFGLHHFYLRRDRQAFVWWSTFGGYFCFGWFRDLWRIPDYVDEANQECEFMETLRRKMKLRRKPQFSVARFSGELLIGYYYGIIARIAIPDVFPKIFCGVVVSVAIAAGVFLVGNIGREKGPFKQTYVATLLTWFLFKILFNTESFTYCGLVSACTFNYYNKYDDSFPNKPFCSRVATFCKGAAIVWLVWISFLYFNSTVKLPNQEEVKLRDAISHFFRSPAWLDFKRTMWELYKDARREGWSNMYDEFVAAMDPTGEAYALKVLGVSKTSSVEEIRKAYKALVVQWHPDRYKGPDKTSAELRFIEIQQAYELLSKRTKRFSEQKRAEKTDL